MNPGKLAVAAILALGVALTAFAIWFQRVQRDQALAYWGTEAGLLVRDAPTVELIKLAPPDSTDADTLRIDGVDFAFQALIEISDAPGVIKLRLALIEDRAFDWSEEDSEIAEPAWRDALRFGNGTEELIVALDVKNERIRRLPDGPDANIGPIAGFLRRFVRDRWKQ